MSGIALAHYKDLVVQSYNEWNKDKAPRLGAALAYYTIFSLPPLLVIVIAVAGAFYGSKAVSGQLMTQLQGLVGAKGAEVIQSMVASASKPGQGLVATIVGVITLLIGATGVFGQLKDALNTVWNVQAAPSGGLLQLLKERFLSFAMVLCLGFLFLVSMVASTAISAVLNAAGDYIPGPKALIGAANLVLSFGVTTVIFAAMYKVLPDVQIKWRSVWIGAVTTAALFSIGKFLIGLYLGKSNVASTYGIAGSVILLLLWIYYTAQIFLFGAEFTQVYALSTGDLALPKPNARKVEAPHERAEPSATRQERAPAQNEGFTRSDGRHDQPSFLDSHPPARSASR